MTAILTAIRLALRAIARAKLRAALTMLGILIGVAAVVAVVALGDGVSAILSKQISGLGANLIFIYSRPTLVSGVKQKPIARLTEADGEAVRKQAASVLDVAAYSSSTAQVVFGDKNVPTQIAGVTRAYWHVRGYDFAKGESFTDRDEALKARVVVIGDTVRENLFGTGDGIGEYVRIGRHAYRVVGLLAKKGQSPFGEDQDDRLVMPLSSFRARVLPSPPGRVHMLLASATSDSTVDRATAQIEQILRQRHHTDPEDEPDVGIQSQAELRKAQEAIFGTLRLLLSSIAAVSLFVGGVGVMNIMLVSVTERTREIGIRMAIGADQADILVQFLVEAVTLCALGGLAGLIVATIAIEVLGTSLEWPMKLSLGAVVTAFATSGLIGVAFGFFPARRAARMDPISALRHE